MPTFVFTDPSGKTHEVTGPAGATQEQAFGILQQRLGASAAPPAAPPPPREATSKTDRFLAGLVDPVFGAAQIADKAINPIRQMIAPGASSMADVIRERDKNYVAPEGVDWMRMAGNVANPVNLAAPGAGVARAAAMGATQSALAPVDPDADFLAEKAKQTALGGAAGGVLSKVLPKVLSGTPFKPTAEARALQDAGVTLTPGQAAGGWVNDLEQKATSIPLAGFAVHAARRRALDDFQERALERAVGAARGKGPKTAYDAQQAVSELYQQVVPKLRSTGEAEVDVLGAVSKAADNPELTPGNLKVLEDLHTKFFGQGGERYMKLQAGELKDLDTELGVLARKYEKSVLPSDQTLGEEIRNMQQAMRQAWRHHLDPADAAKLDAANQAHARMVPVHKAASGHGGPEQRVFPRALQKAMARAQHKDVSRMKPDALVDPAARVLSSTVPDSGTVGRGLTTGALLGGAGLLNLPATLAGGAAAGLAYTRTGSNLLTGNTRLQRAMADELTKLEPATRKALIAALRSAQASSQDKGE